MTRRVLVLHAYSAANAGDGLLVEETLTLLRKALGEPVDFVLLASRPDTFRHLVPTTYPTTPTLRGWDPVTKSMLRQIDNFDLVVGVGGGYLRTGTIIEAAKTLLVQGPQLRAAARSSTPTLYLPQSIGPARFGTLGWLRRQLRRIDTVMVRDDRTMTEIGAQSMFRSPDLATAAVAHGRSPGTEVDSTPVLSIRAIRGKVVPRVYQLADRMSPYDVYVQSTVGGNDDRPATSTLAPRATIPRAKLMALHSRPRVIVAVRLHAALMALANGHYVVHLAYERKGFGAFGDLGLSTWVHSVNKFDVDEVAKQTKGLLNDSKIRQDYDRRIHLASQKIANERERIIGLLRSSVGISKNTLGSGEL